MILIITGMSGAGKSSVIRFLEDIGYYCIDNIPPKFIADLAKNIFESDKNIQNIAIGTDVRSGDFSVAMKFLDELKDKKFLFVEADDEVLIRRYKETRRKHPLDTKCGGDLHKAVATERKMLSGLRLNADYLIDTTYTTTGGLRNQIAGIVLDSPKDAMQIKVVSFGFKYGSPYDADLVFDVRCLPNPFYIKELRHKIGTDKEVNDYVFGNEKAVALLEKLKDLMGFLAPLYYDEGKTRLVIAFGCTGGKHRSVAFAEKLGEFLKEKNLKVFVEHRDTEKH
ncbi:MAG: RNase adapter RapZ [Ruminococcus sp.]|jgi:UPF0042 nucleotide-binding protein|nr:RNase adapter RapZ [Ruminococcus sp.]